MIYKHAELKDVDLLVRFRLSFIEVYSDSSDYDIICKNCRRYFQNSLSEGSCDAIIAEDSGNCIGTGIIFYYTSVPSKFNPTGKNAYITNLYVDSSYRRKGIGISILDHLVKLAVSKEYFIIMLNSTESGRPLYEKYGFREIENGMIIDGRKL